uniref:Wsv327-like protein n=1 Tax=Hemigrapsus takanoi nimavirus TaxID=2133792 RepID=A0A401IP19_9VIRU|nr:wsv327-like protein [Hemigrapsus takanoi nimavirus]
MKRPIYLLSGAYGSRNPSNGYVSEGLISLPLYLAPNTTVVCSSDVLGPSWFTSGKAAKVSLRDEENLKKKLSSVDIRSPLINDNAVLSPRWVLSDHACKILTDFKYIKQGPVLTILNAFEFAMRNVIVSANELSAPGSSRNKIDAALMAENHASKQELVVGRVRRCVALMCYTLIETLFWKERMESKGGKGFDSIPVDVNYRELAFLIKQKCDAFLKGNEVTVASDGLHALPSVTTFVAMVASGAFFGKSLLLPRMVGAFYEAILGVETMSHLERVVSAEYRNLLRAVEDAKRKGHLLPKHRLEEMVEEEGGREPIKDEDEMRWVTLERHRRNGIRNTDMMAMERLAPKGVSFLPTLNANRDGLDTGALDDLYLALEVEGFLLTSSPRTKAIERVFFGRQVSHANFNVSYNPYFSFYILWNWMFLATGALFNTPSNPTTRNLLVNVIVKDMHAILLCLRCYEGIVVKHEETCRLAQQTTMKSARLNTVLRDIMYAFAGREEGSGEKENALFKKIILFDNGGLSLVESEEMINRMTQSEKKKYAFRAITASKGFAAIGLYSLLYSVRLQDLAECDIEEVQLLNRWVLDGSILYTIDSKGNGSSSATPTALTGRDRATIAFIGLWSLRNAVRMRRDVSDPTNYVASSLPSSPMTLSSAMLQNTRFKSASFFNLPYVTNFKEEFVNTVDKFKEEIIYAKRSKTREADAEYYKFGKRRTRARAVEPLGSYKLNDMLKDHPSSRGDVSDRNSSSYNYTNNPSITIGEVALSLENIKGFSKKTYYNLEVFPLTPYDI